MLTKAEFFWKVKSVFWGCKTKEQAYNARKYAKLAFTYYREHYCSAHELSNWKDLNIFFLFKREWENMFFKLTGEEVEF